MSHLVIHIGMPETGSSSIQETLFVLGGVGQFEYADLGVMNHGGVISSFFSDSADWKGHRIAGRSNDQISAFNERVYRKLENIRDRRGFQIISGEAIFHLKEAALVRLRDFFSDAFDEITVVGYVRPPSSYMESSFIQLVKNHECGKLNLQKLWPRYRKKLEKFDRVFGKSNVILRPFTQESLANKDVVQDFCLFLGETIESSLVRRVNESLSLEATCILFAYRRAAPHYLNHPRKLEDNNALIKSLARFGERKLRFSHSLLAPTLECHRYDVEWVENRLEAPLYDGDSPDCGAVHKEADLISIANSNFESFKLYVKSRYLDCDLTPQQIANWVELLRVTVTGRASNGARWPKGGEVLLDHSGRARIIDPNCGPAAALRELAIAFERAGRLSEAETCIKSAIELNPDSAGLLSLNGRIERKLKQLKFLTC